MRKFITPVSMRVTPEQGAEIVKELEKLGYGPSSYYPDWESYAPWLLTSFAGNSSNYGYNQTSNRELIVYNKDLFLALAAMSEGEDFMPGEIVVSTGTWIRVTGEGNAFYKSFAGIVISDCIRKTGTHSSSWNKEAFKKVTKEEIINHFTKKEVKESKKIIGYKAPMDIGEATKKGDIYYKYDSNRYVPRSGAVSSALPKEWVETWEPVYEEEKLTFGGKEVKLARWSNSEGYGKSPTVTHDVRIECVGESSMYSECKKFRDAVETIARFEFGSKPIESIGGCHQLHFITKNKLTIGCTTGTLEEIDKILSKCEEMLKS